MQAYCTLGTHFHLLAASPPGKISYAMMRVLNAYSRHRNRRHFWTGPQYEGRFGSKPVRSRVYWRTLLRYIAQNPVHAGLCDHAAEYAYSSVRHFIAGNAPQWFDRAGVLRRLSRGQSEVAAVTQRFLRLARAPLTTAEFEIIERRMTQPRLAEDELDQLFRSPPHALAQWMARKTAVAGGQSPWSAVAGAAAVAGAIAELRQRCGDWRIRLKRRSADGWLVLAVGLLHGLACVTLDGIAQRLDVHRATAARHARRHREMLGDDAYAERAGIAARRAIDLTFGEPS